MAKKRRRKYSRGSGEEVRREMHRYKRGRAKSGRGGKGGKVKAANRRLRWHFPRRVRRGKEFPERSAEGVPQKGAAESWRVAWPFCLRAARASLPSCAQHRATVSTAPTNSRAESCQVGSRAAAARAFVASRRRSAGSPIRRRSACANAAASSVGTSRPVPAGTVWGIAP
jgi:hypothetical protein